MDYIGVHFHTEAYVIDILFYLDFDQYIYLKTDKKNIHIISL